MRRFDAVLLLAVSVFAAFVGAQVFHATSARAAVHKKPVVVAAEPRARSASPATQQQPTIVGSDSSELRTMIVSSARPAPVRDEADIRLRMAAVASGTYMSDMLADLNGMLVRWPDRPGEPLRVWVQRTSDVPDWQAANTQTAENAFADWQHSGFPLRFDFVLDSTLMFACNPPYHLKDGYRDDLFPVVNFGTDLVNPNFADVAQAMGIFGRRVERPSDLQQALGDAFAHDGPALVDVVTARQELSIPPAITVEQAKGFSLYAIRTILAGRGDELLDLITTNVARRILD